MDYSTFEIRDRAVDAFLDGETVATISKLYKVDGKLRIFLWNFSKWYSKIQRVLQIA